MTIKTDTPKKETKTKPLKARPGTLPVTNAAKERKVSKTTAIALSTITSNLVVANVFTKDSIGELDLLETFDFMTEEVHKVQAGDLSNFEATLVSQAMALDKIFSEMARRAASNMGHQLHATELYMRLALKAQSQCRTTLQTLADIKNPQSVSIVKQANISHGPQQINNGMPATTAGAEEFKNQPNELIEVQHGSKSLDSRSTGATITENPAMASLGEVYRPANT